MGLLHDDAEWNTVLEDAALISICQQMHELFVALLLFCDLAEPAILFKQHNPQMGDDFICQIQAGGGAEPTDTELRTMVLIDIEQRQQSVGRQLCDFYLPSIDPLMRDCVSQLGAHMRLGQLSCELREELLYDAEVEQEKADEWMEMLLDSQRTMAEAVLHAVQHSLHFSAFIDAPGGMGKTFCFNLLLAAVRAHGQIALAVASSGIDATLLTGGRTFHSCFKAPLQPEATSVCSIKGQSTLAEVIRRAKLIIWNETPMAHRHLLEALDRTLLDLMDNNLPFGGKVIILGGDF